MAAEEYRHENKAVLDPLFRAHERHCRRDAGRRAGTDVRTREILSLRRHQIESLLKIISGTRRMISMMGDQNHGT